MTALLTDPIYREHLQGRTGHPERPERFDAVMEGLEPLLPRLTSVPCRTATDDELLMCHSESYLRRAKHDVESGQICLSTGAPAAITCASASAQAAPGFTRAMIS